ncbi:MAG: Crp/Fnr family transcriptional regulator [Ruminococcus sp.]|nr:Crp/Fnr family transcriptional regulator [Ruminococcus sp.]
MDFTFISKTALFRGYCEKDIAHMAKQLNFKRVCYKKKDEIFSNGDTVAHIGLVLSGSVQIEHNDYFGNKSILAIIEKGGVFAEAYACIPGEPLMIDVIANDDCEILFISVSRLFESCPQCDSKNRLIQNLVVIGAYKNLQLSKRSIHTTPKTIRGRLMSYFSEQIYAQDSNKITIPFDRQQLADYLNTDRSALSKELIKMKKDGLIEYRKNVFEIKLI